MLTVKQVANRLNVSEHTIRYYENHKQFILNQIKDLNNCCSNMID